MRTVKFRDRSDAGRRLGEALKPFHYRDPLVLAIPRGGVSVAFEAARILKCRFSLLISRKLPLPGNPEAGFGAVAEDGTVFIDPDARRWLEASEIDSVIEEQKQEIIRRKRALRNDLSLPDLKRKTVILADDGIAAGSTMRVSVEFCRKRECEKTVIAAPVSGQEQKRQMELIADDVVILETPLRFQAVAQVYENWYDVDDGEVQEILREADEKNILA